MTPLRYNKTLPGGLSSLLWEDRTAAGQVCWFYLSILVAPKGRRGAKIAFNHLFPG